MIVRKAELSIAKRLAAVAGEDAQLEAKFLLQANGFHSPYQELSETDARALDPLIERRLAGEPLAYILGEWEFYGLPFYVDRTVLIPRPDTECLVEAALKLLDAEHNRVLDLCCGSGCIGIALAACGGAKVTASDISADALDMTERNARRNGVSLELIRSDFLDEIDGEFDLIVCNPPYFTEGTRGKRALQRHADASLLSEWCRAAFLLLKNGGTLTLCYPAQSLAVLFRALDQNRLSPKRMELIFQNSEARLALIEAKKGGGDGLILTASQG